jgi:glycosyltransferase involved in cell wall biosynthesis
LGVIAVDLDTPSNRMVYNNDRIRLIGPEVSTAVTQLRDIIVQCRNDSGSSRQLSLDESYDENLAWVSQQRSIYQALFGKGQPELTKVSVCIPTRNAGPQFELLMFALQKQLLVNLELCIIDTNSEDQTLDIAYRYFPDAVVHRITKAEFGHGKTRNRLAEMASNEYILFLTQDAIPLDELLVVSLAMHVSKDPKICGSFCSHVANPSHSRFVAYSMEKHFKLMARSFSARNFATGESDTLKYRFFSTNCALVNRSLLLAHPFDDVVYGEDQIWAAQMLSKGFGTAFVPDVSVMHSHNYDGDDLVAKTRTDLEFHKIHFGDFANWSQESLDKHTDKVAAVIGASREEIEHEKWRNVLKMRGYELAKNSDEVSYSA